MVDKIAGSSTQSDDGSRGGALTEPVRRVLQAVYGVLRERSAWPTFRTVDLRFDRDLDIGDAQTALASVPAAYLQRPWHAFGYYDNDDVRLTLRGIQQCDGGPEDLQLLLRLVRWLCEIEQTQDPVDESDPVAFSTDFAAAINLPVETEEQPEPETSQQGDDASKVASDETGSSERPEEHDQPSSPVSPEIEQNRATLVRLYVLADLLVPPFWSSAGWPGEADRWRWFYAIDHRRIRGYREIQDVDQLIEHVERERELLARQRASARIGWTVQDEDTTSVRPDDITSGSETEQAEEILPPGGEIDVLLTILRPEIVDSAAVQLRTGQYDEAIFAAYRRVEAAVQERAGLANTIGDPLVKQAFKEAAAPIRVSERAQDADRLVQLFAGAIGLYKGDRSHKDKPALPCRSLRECLRQLANASALLDLLDRDMTVAPHVRGYDQHADMLELWVERASAQSQVWLDDRPVDVIRHGVGTLILDAVGVPAGEHDLFIVDGTHTSPVTQVWLTRGAGRENWQRVSEVNIPLYAQATGPQLLDPTGLRLTVRENGVTSERIVPTVGSYRVGDYVSHHYAIGAAVGSGSVLGPAWANEGPGLARHQLWVSSALFNGEPYAPIHEARLMKVTLEPKAVLLRLDERTPITALGHYTDGVGTWSEPLTDYTVTVDNDKIAYVRNGVVFAKGYGKTTLRLECNGLYAASTVHVAAHPTGTVADVLTGLPPVAGIAWAGDALIISTRTSELWRLGTDGTYQVAAGVPLQAPTYGGTDTIAAAPNGDLAVRLLSSRDVLVLDKASGYRKSRWAASGEDGTVMAMTWDNADLIVALNTGSILRLSADGTSKQIAVLPGPIVSIDRGDEELVAVTQGNAPGLWQIPLSEAGKATSLVSDAEPTTLNVVAWLNGHAYLTDFHGGRVLRVEEQRLTELTTGLHNPGELAVGPDGSIYVAEFGRGAVLRLLP